LSACKQHFPRARRCDSARGVDRHAPRLRAQPRLGRAGRY